MWLLRTGNQVGCTKLRKKSRLVALKFFEELHNSQQLLALDCTRLSQIIKSKKLRSADEQVVLEAVLAWLTHDAARRPLAVDLLRLVRLPRLSEAKLDQLKAHPALQDASNATGLQTLLSDLQRYKGMTEAEQREHKAEFSSLWTKKRWCECGWLYAVGGSDGQHHLDSVERYEAVEDVWHPVAPMRTARRNCGVGVLRSQLYAVGGRNEHKQVLRLVSLCKAAPHATLWNCRLCSAETWWCQVMDNIERYDSKEDRWERVDHPMRTARYFLAVGVMGDKLYVVGGVDKRNASLASAECYDSSTGRWTPVASMSQRRYGCGAGVLNGKLYVIGGTMEKNGDYLDTAERYDPVADLWEDVAPMSTSRYCCGVCVINGKLFAVGGVDKKYVKLASVESFDPVTGEWSQEPSMLTARYNCGVEESAGKMYVVGGRDEKNRALQTVECFDTLTSTWYPAAPMGTVRSSGAVAVLPPTVS